MKRNLFISLALILTLAAIVVATNTYSGGVTGSSAGNALLRSTGDHAVGGSAASDDGTTFTVNTTPTSGTAKFSITEASGNTTCAGTFTSTGAGAFSSTLNSVGDFSVASTKFTVAAATGNSVTAGTLTSTGDFAVGSSKFNVTAASGNTTNAGTFTSTGVINGPFGATVDTATPVVLTAAQSGQVHISNSTADAVQVYTLPVAAVAGGRHCFALGSSSLGSNREIDVEPAGASDLIIGTTTPAGSAGIATTAGPGHGIKNTHATAVRGNSVCLQSDGVNTYYMTSLSGVWAAY